ncbi:hypothetical protein HRbin15_02624 [bacterium HR15]|nr:hypothetical protein HRbin15_02624 [bacterium HR15]
MKRLRTIWLLGALCGCFQGAISQNNLPTLEEQAVSTESELSASLPEQWLILQPGEVVTLVASPVLGGMETASYWHALNGEVLSVSRESVVYQAPTGNDETFDVLIWHNPLTGQWATVGITLICETEPVKLESETIEGQPSSVYRIPTSSNAGVQIFALGPGSSGGGFSICLNGRPQNPPPPSSCSGGPFRTTRTKFFTRCSPWWYRGTLVVDAHIQARVRRAFGITLRIGAVYHVYMRECRETKLTIQDCYECRNGRPVYVGSRVFYKSKRWFEITPNWASLFYTLPPPSFNSGCVSSGNCPC